MTEAEREQALELLRDPKLLDRILADFDTCGLVGERTNSSWVSGRRQSQARSTAWRSGAVLERGGESSLMDAVLSFMPEEERIKYSAMTGQSLFYMGKTNLSTRSSRSWRRKGRARASYALKLLQSEGN